MEIEELPDLKIGWDRAYEYQDVPLLDYVWEVANKFLPSVEDTDIGMMPAESIAPAIFSNRYFERNLTIEERYERAKEMGMCNMSFEKFYQRDSNANYRKLNDSFKEKFLTNEDLQNTIEAFGLDVSKFWYLLLFVYDFIEDICTETPALKKNTFDDINEFKESLLEATGIFLYKNGRKDYATENSETIKFAKTALQYYINLYNHIINGESTREEKLKQLEDIGWNDFIRNDLSTKISLEETSSLDKSYKKWKFAELFLYFLEDKKADRSKVSDKRIKVSIDKNMFISRLIYIVSYGSEVYNNATDKNGKPNRMLSLLLRKYGNEKFPSVIGRYYMAVY